MEQIFEVFGCYFPMMKQVSLGLTLTLLAVQIQGVMHNAEVCIKEKGIMKTGILSQFWKEIGQKY